MNEEELKEIWRTKEVIPLKSINMEFIQQYTQAASGSLQKLSRKETLGGIGISAIFVVNFIYSGNFYIVLMAMTIIWIYAIWKKRRDERLDEQNRTENVKSYLINKERKLKREISRQRIYGFLGVYLLIPAFNMLDGTFYEKLTNPLRYIIILTVTFIVVQTFIEFYTRLNYNPILEDLRYLIEQLDEDEKPR